MTPTQEAGFRARIKFGHDTECWPWTGPFTSTGFAWYRSGGHPESAPRAAWKLWRGEIPTGKLVIHTCRTHHCVNPAHLKIGTQADKPPPLEQQTKCYRCKKPLLRSSNMSRAICRDCNRKAQAERESHRTAKLREQARHYRILLHLLGYEDSQFAELCAEIRRSPMAFRDCAETRLARLDATREATNTAERKRLLAAYGEGLDMESMIERFGKTADVINKTAERAGVSRPAGHIGHVRRTQARGAA